MTDSSGSPLPCDTEVLVTLTDLSIDCDLAVIEDARLTTESVVDLGGTSFPSGDAWANAGKVWGGGGKVWGGGGKVWGGGGKVWGGGSTQEGLDAVAPLRGWDESPAETPAYTAWMDAGKVWGGGGKVWGGGGKVWGGGGKVWGGGGKIWGGGGKVWGGGGKIWGGGGKVWGGGDTDLAYRSPESSMLYSHLAPTDDSTKLMDGYSFYDLSFTGLDEDRTAGADITFEELGFSNEQAENMSIAGVSAMSGTQDEVVLAQVTLVGGHTYIAVKGANGASSDKPYTLQVETSEPLDVGTILNTPNELPKIVEGSTTATVPVIQPEEPQPKTLFVTQAERMKTIYGGPAWTALEDQLDAVCGRSGVDGLVLSVPSTIYDEWDKRPWDTQLANGVTDQIRKVIDDYIYGNENDPATTDDDSPPHPSIRYVVLVGGDEILPQRRVTDQTVLCNERSYVRDAGLNPDSSLLASMNDAMVLTDDFYVDAEPIPYNGRSLYVPDLAVARLIETPAEIVGEIQQFIANDGKLLGGAGSVVTGQDWMDDGARRVNGILKAAGLAGQLDEPLLDTWTIQQLRDSLLNGAAKRGNINAHFLHYGGITAAGCTKYAAGDADWPTEFLTGSEIAAASSLTGKLVFSLGCHAGLNVPDVQAMQNWDIDLGLDVAQAIARQKGVLVASTGYGLGDLNGIAGTEALMGTFAEEVTTAVASGDTSHVGQPIGLALAMAKRKYLNSLTAVTPYDEKSSIELTMYGMPQYRIPCTTHPPSSGLETTGVGDPATASFDWAIPDKPFNLTVTDENGTVTTYNRDLIEVSQSRTARYVTANGDAEVIAARPIEPRIVINLGTVQPDQEAVSGAVLTDGQYVDILNFDPAISHFVNEWETHIEEPQVCSDGWWPANPVTVSTIDTPEGLVQRLIVIPGQFFRTSPDGEAVSRDGAALDGPQGEALPQGSDEHGHNRAYGA